MRRDQNPASIPFDIENHNPKNNPSISWKEVPELFEKINSHLIQSLLKLNVLLLHDLFTSWCNSQDEMGLD